MVKAQLLGFHCNVVNDAVCVLIEGCMYLLLQRVVRDRDFHRFEPRTAPAHIYR